MTKEETKNSIIGLIILILIVGGIIIYKRTQKEGGAVIENTDTLPSNNTDETIPETPIGGAPTDNPDNSTNSGVPAKPTGGEVTISSENTPKFNTAMKNASLAINKAQYDKAVTFYQEALTYLKSDTAYMGLFTAYGAQGDWVKARTAIDAAIAIKPSYTEYWTSKLIMLDEKTNTSFTDLKKIYTEGLTKVDPKTKVNLVVQFARIAETNSQKNEAIALWKYAKEIYPDNATIYQAEIDRLNKQ